MRVLLVYLALAWLAAGCAVHRVSMATPAVRVQETTNGVPVFLEIK